MSSVKLGEWWPSQRCTCTTFRPCANSRDATVWAEGVEAGPPDAGLLARGREHAVGEVVGVEQTSSAASCLLPSSASVYSLYERTMALR